MFTIVPENPENSAERERLLDIAFGKNRYQLTVYKLRRGIKAAPGLSHVALVDGIFQGSLRFWPVLVEGSRSPLLLGPLAVSPARQGQAIGVALVRNGLQQAQKLGHDLVILVGDYEYYKRFGFVHTAKINLSLPGPYDPLRLLARRVPSGEIRGIKGPIRRADGKEIYYKER